MEALRRCVLRLTAALGAPAGGRLDGITAASVQMLSKMISRYDVTKARARASAPFPAAPRRASPLPPQVSVAATQRALSESAPNAAAYAEKYGALKAAGVRELDRLLLTVAKIAQGAPPPPPPPAAPLAV